MNVYNFIKFGVLTFVAVGGSFVIIFAIMVLRNEIHYEYDSFSEFFSEIFKKKKMKVKMRDLIKSLGKDDFNIVSEHKNGVVNISQDDGLCCFSKKLELSGETKIGMQLPQYSLLMENRDYNPERFCNNTPTVIWITEQQYKDYLDLIKDFDKVATDSFFLKIELKNTDVISSIKNGTHVPERYNVLNLVTNIQPFSEKEIDLIIDEMKERIIVQLDL